MVTITSTSIAPKKTSVISTDIRGGGAYTTYRSSSGIRVTYSGGGGRSASDIKKLVTPTLYTSDLLKQSFISLEAKEKAEQEYKQEQARQKAINQLLGQSRTQQSLRSIGGISSQETAKEQLMSKISDIKSGAIDLSKNLFESGKIGLGGKAGSELITKGVKKLYEFERKKYQQGKGQAIVEKRLKEREEKQREQLENEYEKNKLPNETKLEYIRRTKPKWYAGGSIVQKYYELFGVKFYGEGEREELVNEGLKNFTSAKTYEQQQEAITQLKKQGINVTLKDDVYTINAKNVYDKFAPTSKLADTLVSLTHGFFISTIFSPLISQAGTKKTTTKTKVVEKTTGSKNAEKIIRKAEELFKSGELEKELYTLQTKATTPLQQNNLKALLGELQKRSLIKGFAIDEATGKFILLDSTGKEIIPRISTQTPKLTLQFDISDLANIPRIPSGGLGTATGGISILTSQDNLFIQKDGTKLQDMTKPNMFLGTAPSGKIKDLGVLGTGLTTKQQQKQQTKQLELLKQIPQEKQSSLIKQSLALSSLLKSSQQLKQLQVQKLAEKVKQKSKLKSKFPKPFGFKLTSLISDVKKGKVKDEDIYSVFGKRFGKDIEIFKTKSKKQAEQETIKFLKGTLGRSAVITKGGKPLKFSELGGLFKTGEFRPSKKSKTRIVQKKEYSLSSFPERKEIQYFKRKSSGKKKKKRFSLWNL